jgi:hypothetical protein
MERKSSVNRSVREGKIESDQMIEGSGPGGAFSFNVQLPVIIHNDDSDACGMSEPAKIPPKA